MGEIKCLMESTILNLMKKTQEQRNGEENL